MSTPTTSLRYSTALVVAFGACVLAAAPPGVAADTNRSIQTADLKGVFKDIGDFFKDTKEALKGGKEAYEEGEELKEAINKEGKEAESATHAELSEMIRETQQRLTNIGFDAGPVDGILGTKTTGAILSFQKVRGLPQDGKVSTGLLAELRSIDNTPYQGSAGSGTADPWSGTQGASVNWSSGEQSGGSWPSNPQPGGNWPSSQQPEGSWPAQQEPGGNWPSNSPAGGGSGTVQPTDSAVSSDQGEGGGLIAPALEGAAVVKGAPLPASEAPDSGGMAGGQPSASATGGYPSEHGSAAPPQHSDANIAQSVDMSAVAQRYGLRMLQGRPVLGVGSSEREIESMRRFFSLLSIRLNYDLFNGDNASADYALNQRQLCVANTFLSSAKKDQVLAKESQSVAGTGTHLRNWKGFGQNEFEIARAREKFVKEFLPQIVAKAPSLPLELIYVMKPTFSEYDSQRRGFELNLGHGMSGYGTHKGTKLPLPDPYCHGYNKLAFADIVAGFLAPGAREG